jgi:GTP-binding protein LepA
MEQKIRNFCIIAHIDHGKSTLADRFLEVTGRMEKREMKNQQMLDTMDIEQERGITIKLQPVRMQWKGYELNVIDTPGHVDFQYEVSRSLAACEGAILVVDASQGIEAQTIANVYLAIEHDLTIIPVLNKIDLPAADVEKVAGEIENVLGIPKEEIIPVSAKTGKNVDTILDAVIKRLPEPKGARSTEGEVRDLERKALNPELGTKNYSKALIFDSTYDQYKGVLAFVRVFSGSFKRGDKVHLLGTESEMQILEVGEFTPKYKANESLDAGQVGYIVTGLKSTSEARVGDTVYQGDNPKKSEMLPGYKKIHPVVYAAVFAVNGDDYPLLRDALDKLSLNDSSLSFEPEQSSALGYGFRCGFLGLLHMEIVQERLEREYDLGLIITAPSVNYEILKKSGDVIHISSPAQLPDLSTVDEIREPYVKLEIIVPKEYIGGVMDLGSDHRGIYKEMSFVDEDRAMLVFEIPLATIISEFFDTLKSITQGYASMSYDHIGFREDKLVKVDIIVADEKISALSFITHKDFSEKEGRQVTLKLKEVIPSHQFAVAIQAVIGGKIIARETVSAMRKDVTAKLYGGDVSRKKKVLEKQKKGKARLKSLGKVTLSQEAFMSVLKR